MSATDAKRRASRADTRKQLIRAAERLFAESGIDGVSLRQINVAAGQKNSSAAHYHFGSKDSLILSVYETRMASVNREREAHLDALEKDGLTHDVRSLVEAIVRPIVHEIDADDSGRYYIRFMAQAMGHPQLDLEELWQQEHNDGLMRTINLLREALPDVPAPLLGQRFGLAFEQIIHSLADREKLRSSAKHRHSFEVDSALFVSNLIDVIAGAMTAPVSDQTRQDLERIAAAKRS